MYLLMLKSDVPLIYYVLVIIFNDHFFSNPSLYFFFFQAEDGIRDRSPSRGLGDVYIRQTIESSLPFNNPVIF